MDKKNIIKRSLEAQCYKHDLLLLTIAYVFLSLFSVLIFSAYLHDYPKYLASLLCAYLVIISCICLPFILYSAGKYAWLFKEVRYYRFADVVLDRAHISGKKGYFTVTICDDDGNKIDVTTCPIFYLGIKKPCFDEYINKKVCIAYNVKTKSVLIVPHECTETH